MIVIGLVGEKGSGKGTFATYLAEIIKPKRLASVRFSDLLYETLGAWHISPTRTNLQKIAVVMDGAYGVGTLSHAIHERVSKLDADIVVIDGVRWETDVALVRRFPKNMLVYITASPRIRYERTIARAEKADEANTSFEQFMQEEQAANETSIPKFGATADYTIRNEGTMEEYKDAIGSFYKARFS